MTYEYLPEPQPTGQTGQEADPVTGGELEAVFACFFRPTCSPRFAGFSTP